MLAGSASLFPRLCIHEETASNLFYVLNFCTSGSETEFGETVCSYDSSVAGFVEDVSTQTATVSTQTATDSTDASVQTVATSADIHTQTEGWERVTPPPFSAG